MNIRHLTAPYELCSHLSRSFMSRAGGQELSPMLQRARGHVAAYSLDPDADAHVLAFASVAVQPKNAT